MAKAWKLLEFICILVSFQKSPEKLEALLNSPRDFLFVCLSFFQ